MKKFVLLCVIVGLSAVCAHIRAEEREEFEIKQGMRKDAVDEKYGQPVMVEKIKEGFLPIARKKALYKIDDSTYVILHFFSGRVSDITVLDGASLDMASSAFREK